MENLPIIHIDTPLSTLDVFEDYCVLTKKENAINFIAGRYFSGEKRFFYRDLTSLQFREPGKITDGYLEFEFPGSRGGASGGSFQSENAFTFAKPHLEAAREAYEYIQHRLTVIKLGTGRNANISQGTNSADEFLKFKGLLEAGIITQEEFENKKNQILGIDSTTEALKKAREQRAEEERIKQAEKEALAAAEKERKEQEKLERERINALREEAEKKRAAEVKAANKPLRLIMWGASIVLALLGIIISPNGAAMAIVLYPIITLVFANLYLSKASAKTFKTLTLAFGGSGAAIRLLSGLGSLSDPELSVNAIPLIFVGLINVMAIVMTFIKKEK